MFNEKIYKKPYHKVDLSKYTFLVTGGAGFIGSNLVEYLLRYNAGRVRVLDNFSNGYIDNIKSFIGLSNFELIEGDIRDFETCKTAVKNIDFISHQAALGSVPRSIEDPITSNEVNVAGFLNILVAAKESTSLKRFVYAASSSSYGDSAILPKIEGNEGSPLSPYAITKLVNELYANIFSRIYAFHTIGLRYFNVFGPKQNPNNPYAAVIPLFINNALINRKVVINGSDQISRDFTFVENVVQANIKAFFASQIESHEVFNVCMGKSITLGELITGIERVLNITIEKTFADNRKGDIKHSLGSIVKAKNKLGYSPEIDFFSGLETTISELRNKTL